jgi:hypothetical protein
LGPGIGGLFLGALPVLLVAAGYGVCMGLSQLWRRKFVCALINLVPAAVCVAIIAVVILAIASEPHG